MAPKSKSSDSSSGPAKLKPATSINVRHILCEKHAKKEEAIARLMKEHKFDDVAKDLSEDKARQGMLRCSLPARAGRFADGG
jgi:NIMA-interacting peptidyl-prolyl cis-trans isomerase 4